MTLYLSNFMTNDLSLRSVGKALGMELLNDVHLASGQQPLRSGRWQYTLSMSGRLDQEDATGELLERRHLECLLPVEADEDEYEWEGDFDESRVFLSVCLQPVMSMPCCGGLVHRVVTIKEIEVHYGWQGRGLLSGFLDTLEAWLLRTPLAEEGGRRQALVFQNITNRNVCALLGRRGWRSPVPYGLDAQRQMTGVTQRVMMAPE